MKTKEVTNLLDQMIEFEEIKDAKQKLSAKAEDRIGESWMLHHLKLLRGLVEER